MSALPPAEIVRALELNPVSVGGVNRKPAIAFRDTTCSASDGTMRSAGGVA
jgi:hypothetical protein